MSEQRYWVRNEKGRIWGPFSIEAVARVDLGGGDLRQRIQISIDGRRFQPLDDFPEVLRAVVNAAAAAPARRIIPQAPAGPPVPRPTVRPVTPSPVAPTAQAAGTPPESTPTPPLETPDDDPSPPAEGILEEHSPFELYSRVVAANLTGRLELQGDSGEFALFFRKGTPIRVDCPQPAVELARFLVKHNAAPKDALDQALSETGPDGDLVALLVSRQIVAPQEIFRLLGRQGLDLLDRALAMQFGTFAWQSGVAAPPGSFELGNRWALLSGSVRKLPVTVAGERLGQRVHQAVYRTSAARVRLDDLQLTAQELRIASMFDGTRSPELIALALPTEADTVLRTALLLAETAYVTFGPELAAPTTRTAIPTVEEDALPAMERSSATHPRGTAVFEAEGPTVGRVALKAVAVRASDAAASAEEPGSSTPPVPAEAPAPSVARPAESPYEGIRQRTMPPIVTPPPPEPSAPVVSPARSVVVTPPPPSVAAPATAPSPGSPPPVAPPVVAPPRTAPGVSSAPVTPAATAKARPASRPVRPQATAPSPASSVDATRELEASRKLLEKWANATHFEVLGVKESAKPEEVKSVYFGLARRHHPDTVAPEFVELRQVKADLAARLNEAYAVVSDPQAKAQYLEELAGGGQTVDVGHILKAEDDFLRATILYKARRYAEALELIEGAIKLNPDEAEFYAWRGYVRFVSSKEKRLEYDSAVSDCRRALEMSDKCAVAHLFLGHMAKIMGDVPRAERSYRAALEVDPENIEAQRELRLMSARR